RQKAAGRCPGLRGRWFLQGLGLGLGLLLFTGLPAQTTPPQVSISGQVRVPEGVSVPEAGLSVVLLQYVLTEEGQVTTTGPQARGQSDESGLFRFENVPRNERAAYRVGTRVEGKLHSSELFFLRPGQDVFVIDVVIPEMSTDTSQLSVAESSLVLEPVIGGLRVTEVLSIANKAETRVDTHKQPLSFQLPEHAESFRMLNAKSESGFRLQGTRLEILRIFPREGAQVLFQYSVPARFGSMTLRKPVNHSLERVGVFTPSEVLTVRSEQLTFHGEQTIDKTRFRSWRGKASDEAVLEIAVSGIPVDSQDYGWFGFALLIVLAGAVAVFYRFRLRAVQAVA
ncbi:MAG: carboxypeptidase-like regulatory domain-containing protein, partial [SAR324 cluster bacterium]|nr:carboxypeptidase-like regulatory domain-containing protein [SAR324 cluster bacterium]